MIPFPSTARRTGTDSSTLSAKTHREREIEEFGFFFVVCFFQWCDNETLFEREKRGVFGVFFSRRQDKKAGGRTSLTSKRRFTPLLRQRNRGNATLISWSLFLRVLQGRATICQPPRPGGTLALGFVFLSRFVRGADALKTEEKNPSFRCARGIATSRHRLKT